MKKTMTRVGLAVLALAYLAGCEMWGMPQSSDWFSRTAKWDEDKGQYVTENRGD